MAPLGIVVGPDYCLPFRSTERDREVENEGTHCYFVRLVIVCVPVRDASLSGVAAKAVVGHVETTAWVSP